MTVGSFKARFDSVCSQCGRTVPAGEKLWYIKEQPKGSAYYCDQGCLGEAHPEEGPKGNPHSQQQVTTTATIPWSTIESDVAKGHRENMESAKLTRDCLANLTVAIITLRDAIERKIKEGKA